MSVEKVTERLRAMLRGREDRPEDKWLGDGMSPPITVQELLNALTTQAAEIERLRVYEQAFSHTWEFNTKFDKKGEPREIKVLLKITTETSSGMQREVHKLLADFNTNAVGSLG